MTKQSIKTTKEDIVNYWFFEQMIDESGLSVDAAEAYERCWRCGCEKRLERCHIIPESLGGKDEPSNLVLLCHRCHIENPNISDPEIMWDWIRAYGVPFYDTFWHHIAMKEYEFIYHKNYYDELADIGIPINGETELLIKKYSKGLIKETGYHFGHPYLNAATLAGFYRMLLKKLAKKYGKTVLPPDYNSPRRPWWMGIGIKQDIQD